MLQRMLIKENKAAKIHKKYNRLLKNVQTNSSEWIIFEMWVCNHVFVVFKYVVSTI